MKIIGCDFHPGYQQIAVLDSVTGEIVEKALSHERKEKVKLSTLAKVVVGLRQE